MGLTDGVRFPAGEKYLSLFHGVQTGSGTQPAYYPIGAARYFPGVKASEA
jgi:hypothetical protein